jgi:L-threonylcarbamoyladenylate synthase
MPSTVVRPVDAKNPDPQVLRHASDVILSGGLVVIPTETVYGLGANALDAAAVAKVFAAKGRPANNPLIVHVAHTPDVWSLAEWSEPAQRLASEFWPGPLTLVLPKKSIIPDIVTGGGPTVAVRCPAHPVARGVILAAGVPIAAPSANRSGELSPTCAEHVLKSLIGRVELILDAGPCSAGLESTVVDVTQWRVLRPGPITADQLSVLFGPLQIMTPVPSSLSGPLPSPGLLSRHYAPRTALELVESEPEAEFLANLYQTAGLTVARWRAEGPPDAVATHLYADFHELDAGQFDRIIAVLPPAEPAWHAIRDRLIRAAAHED